MLLKNKLKHSDHQQARREYVLPQLFSAMLLNLVFGISWIFALVGTEMSLSSSVALGSQYVFSFLIVFHAVLVLLVGLVRYKDARSACFTCCGARSGSYFVAREHSKQQQRDDTFGMSNRAENIYATNMEKGALQDGDEVAPLTESAASSSPQPAALNEDGEMAEVEQEGMEEKEAETVMINYGADDEDQDEKKTDL